MKYHENGIFYYKQSIHKFTLILFSHQQKHQLQSMINQLKSRVFKNKRVPEQYKVIVHKHEIIEYWQKMSLLEKEKILYITNQQILQNVFIYLNKYIGFKHYRTQNQTVAYTVSYNKQYVLSVYDCIVFRIMTETKEKQMRQLLTSFLIIVKHVNTKIVSKVHQVIDNNIIQSSMIKVKASYILRIQYFLQKYVKDYFEGEKILLDQDLYSFFFNTWTNKPYLNMESYVKDVFEFILVLLENQIIKSFCSTLSKQELKQRKYREPVRQYKKPKHKQSYTMVDNSNIFSNIMSIKWDSLKIEMFKIKYRTIEQKDRYICYNQVNDFSTDSQKQYQTQNNYTQEDNMILNAFARYKQQKNSTKWNSFYYL